jgi:hypothetical protein
LKRAKAALSSRQKEMDAADAALGEASAALADAKAAQAAAAKAGGSPAKGGKGEDEAAAEDEPKWELPEELRGEFK